MAAQDPPKPTAATSACTLPYPDRFHAAVNFVAHPPPGACVLSDERRLVLHALHQQATVGPCTASKPWGWNVVEAAKYDAWSQLGNMPSMEAMRLYVRALEEDQPDWWTLINQRASTPKGNALGSSSPLASTPKASAGTPRQSLSQPSSTDDAGQWNSLEPSGKRPPPRYEHAVASLGSSMFVVGGNCIGGRYLGDVWALHLDPLVWEPVTTSSSQPQVPGPFDDGKGDRPHYLPPCAGHALVSWGSNLLCIGGHTKAKDKSARMAVWVLDKGTLTWSRLRIIGQPPPLRGAHSATLIGSRIFIFGGEDFARRPQSDLYILDMADTAWRTPESLNPSSNEPSTSSQPTPTQPPPQGPSARSAHVAACVGGRFLLVFGGGSIANCFNDLWSLDTQTMVWSQPATEGEPPCPRAGHAADILDGHWYMAGGGNNATGCTDLVSLDISPLGSGTPHLNAPLRWHTHINAPARDPVASEGLSLIAVPSSGCLLAFGGYNGKYHNAVCIFRPSEDAASPTRTLPPSTSARPAPVPNSPMAAPTPTPPPPTAQPSPLHPPNASKAQQQGRQLANGSASAQLLENGGAPARRTTGSQDGGPPPAALTSKSSRRSLTHEDSRIIALTAEVDGARAEANAAKESAAMELAVLRHQLAKGQQALQQAEQARDEAQAGLADAQGRIFKLEVALAEGQKQAQQIVDLEKELARFRKLAEEEVPAHQRRSSSGLWGYISGAPAAKQ